MGDQGPEAGPPAGRDEVAGLRAVADGRLGVEVRHLAALRAVAREGSFGGAALALGYTQSAVSQQIATLERAVGERLVERPGGPRRVSLTEAGAVLLRHAERIVAGMEAAWADVRAVASGEAGEIRVGTYQSVGARILPDVMRDFVLLRDPYVLMVQTGSSLATQAGCAWGISPGSR